MPRFLSQIISIFVKWKPYNQLNNNGEWWYIMHWFLFQIISISVKWIPRYRAKHALQTITVYGVFQISIKLKYTWLTLRHHYNDVIMSAIASRITSLTIVYSSVYADQRKHQSSASLAFVRGIHRWPVNSPYKWPESRKMFPFDDVIMIIWDIECCLLASLQHLVMIRATIWLSVCKTQQFPINVILRAKDLVHYLHVTCNPSGDSS